LYHSDMGTDEDHVTIETPEYVSLSYELAGFGSRVIACFVDSLLVGTAITVVLFAIASLNAVLPNWLAGIAPVDVVGWIIIASPVLIYAGYFIVLESAWNGQTVGKRMVGIRVVCTNGTPIRTAHSFVRNIIRLIDMLPGPYTVGLFSMFVTRRMQRLGDLAAGTMVVKERAWELDRRQVPPPPEVAPAAHATGRLEPAQLAAVERFIERRGELDAPTRARLAAQIAESLRPKFPDLYAAYPNAPERFIEAVHRACFGRAGK